MPKCDINDYSALHGPEATRAMLDRQEAACILNEKNQIRNIVRVSAEQFDALKPADLSALRRACEFVTAGLEGRGAEILGLTGDKKGNERTRSWTIRDAAEILENPPPRPAELIDGIAFVGAKLILAAPSKARKTFAMMHLAACIATGSPWMGHTTKKGRVLYVNLELGTWSFQDRLGAICGAMGQKLEPGMFSVLHLRGKKSNVEDMEAFFGAAIGSKKFSLIVFDPLYKALGDRSENDASEMADLLSRLEAIGHGAGAAILVACHFAKGMASEKEAIDRASGSGVVGRDGDAILSLTPHETEDCFALEATLRDFPPKSPSVLRWVYPIFEIARDLDPAKLKTKPRPSRVNSIISVEQVIGASVGFTEPVLRDTIIHSVMEKTGQGFEPCRKAFNRAEEMQFFKNSLATRTGKRPQSLYLIDMVKVLKFRRDEEAKSE